MSGPRISDADKARIGEQMVATIRAGIRKAAAQLRAEGLTITDRHVEMFVDASIFSVGQFLDATTVEAR